jgi:hypothetical protein
MQAAQEFKPDVLVLVLFGNDMSTALKLADTLNVKKTAQVVVPNITLGMAESAGPRSLSDLDFRHARTRSSARSRPLMEPNFA